MTASARKISQKELILFYQIYQNENTSFQLLPEVIRLIRAGEPCLNVLQRKFGFTLNDIERFQQASYPPEAFRNFLLRLHQQSLITSDEIQNEPNPAPPKNAVVPTLTVIIILLVCLTLWVFREPYHEPLTDVAEEESVPLETIKTTPPSEKNEAFVAGLKAEKEGNSSDAKKAFQEVLAQHPKHLAANFHLGKLLLAEKQYEEAHSLFNRVIQSDDQAPEDLLAKTSACYILNHLEWGEQFALQALPHLPKNRELLTLLGQIQWALGKEKESLEFLEKALSEGSTDDSVLMILAENYWKQGKLDQAMQPLQKFLMQHPQDSVALKILGQIEIAQGKESDGLVHLEKTLSQSPPDFSMVTLLISGYRSTAQWEKALSLLESFLKEHPQESVALNLYGEILLEMGQREKAIAQFEASCQSQKDNVRAQLNRAVFFEEENKLDQALEIYDLCLQIQPNSELARYNRALLFLRLKKLDNAEQDILFLEKQFPKNPLTLEGLKSLGSYYYAQKEFEKAQDYFARILQRQENDEEALLRYGMCALKNKKYEDTRQSFEKLLRLNPEHPKKELLEQFLNSLEKSK